MSETESNTSHKATSGDMSVSGLLRLAGIPTVSEIRLLEAKLDRLDKQLTAIQTKLDKLSLSVGASSSEGFYDRVDFQLGEIKALLSKIEA